MSSMTKHTVRLLHVLVLALFTMHAVAAGRGDGACVTSDEAPIYADATAEQPIGKWLKGTCVGGATKQLGGIAPYQALFEEANGRVRATFINSETGRGKPAFGWMKATDLSRFTYECSCQKENTLGECPPYSIQGASFTWVYNACFKEAAAKKMEEISKGASVTAAKEGVKGNSTGNILRNEDIMTLSKVGLDDSLILSKIKAAEETKFDLSTEGLVALKAAKVSNAVIDAMMKRSVK